MKEYRDYGYQNDQPFHNFFYLKDAVLSMLDKNRNKCILDLGCGNGHLANFLIDRGFNVYGIDASLRGIAIARQKRPDHFFVQDVSSGKLPVELRGKQFDTIISTEVIEHLYAPRLFVDFCRRVLTKQKGDLIISTPYHGYFKNLLLSLLNKWDPHMDPLWDGGHIKFWSFNKLRKLLTDQGFAIVAFKGCGRVPYLWKSMVIKAKLL
jgi:2-polyprenyl-3-methyl-5-hydroxy-6-metoxy-1,4-benzoquinol methylase